MRASAILKSSRERWVIPRWPRADDHVDADEVPVAADDTPLAWATLGNELMPLPWRIVAAIRFIETVGRDGC